MTLQPIFSAPLATSSAPVRTAAQAGGSTPVPADSVNLGQQEPVQPAPTRPQPQPQPPLSNNPLELGERQFADSYGRVTNLALMLSSYASGTARKQMLDAYKTLFTRMEPDTKFTIAVGSARDRQDIERAMAECNCPNPERIQFVDPDAGSLTVWARDMMVPLQLDKDPNRTALLGQTPLHNWHDNDTAVPPAICAQNPSILLDDDKSLVTDGGDVMSNNHHSLVGYYSLSATAERLAKSVEADPEMKEKFIADFEARTGKRVVGAQQRETVFPYQQQMIDVGDSGALPWTLVENPKFRDRPLGPNEIRADQMYEQVAQDMFSKKFGKPVIVMGKDDPTTTHHEEPATDHMDMGCTPIDDNTFFVGDPNLAKSLVAKMSPEEIRDAERILSESAGQPVRLPRPGDRNRDNQQDFDAYEKTLKEQGYNVVRLPHAEPGISRSYISYNNCLMERFEREDGSKVRRVFLPVYGIPKLDDYAIKTWESQDFEVIPMPLGGLSQRWGALRCVSNWLDRSPHAEAK